MDAAITIEFTMKNVCNKGDPERLGLSLREMVEDILESDCIMGCVEDEYRIVEVKETTND